jgi:hypothetical protein
MALAKHGAAEPQPKKGAWVQGEKKMLVRKEGVRKVPTGLVLAEASGSATLSFVGIAFCVVQDDQ